MRWAVSNWYDRNPDQLALQAVKYRQRDGWSHRDLLRLAHPKNKETAALFDWICHGLNDGPAPATLVHAFELAQRSVSAKETAGLVRDYNLPREALLPDHLADQVVWLAMLETGMPMTAMMRNLANMTRIGALDSSQHRAIVRDAFADKDAIRKARVHPLAILVALRTYASGHGLRGQNTWKPKPDIIDVLDEAFYLAFDNVDATGKRHLLALDVSGSMGMDTISGTNLTPREASVAMALVTLHAEQETEIVGFAGGLVSLPFSRRQRLDDAVRSVSHLPFGMTDCALPMLYASQAGREFDAFIVYTDSETWAGNVHPKQALDRYRKSHVHDARSVVVGMVSNGFTIADPQDAGMMDVVGFDTAAPMLIADFVRGAI